MLCYFIFFSTWLYFFPHASLIYTLSLSLCTVHYFLHDLCTFSICMYKSESTYCLRTVPPTLSNIILFFFFLIFIFNQWQTLTLISSLLISSTNSIIIPHTITITLLLTLTTTTLIISTISSTTQQLSTLPTLFSTIIIFKLQLLLILHLLPLL